MRHKFPLLLALTWSLEALACASEDPGVPSGAGGTSAGGFSSGGSGASGDETRCTIPGATRVGEPFESSVSLSTFAHKGRVDDSTLFLSGLQEIIAIPLAGGAPTTVYDGVDAVYDF